VSPSGTGALAGMALALAGTLAAQDTTGARVLDVASAGETVRVGEPFVAGALVHAPEGASIDLLPGPGAERHLERVSAARVHAGDAPGRHRVVATFVVWVVDPPSTAPAEVRVRLPGGDLLRIPIALPLPAVVATLPDDAEQPRGPRDIVPAAAGTARLPAWIAALALGLLLLLLAAVRARRRMSRGGSPPSPAERRRRALAALERLRAADLVASGRPDEHYAVLVALLLDYAAPRRRPDLTTTEAVERLAAAGGEPEAVGSLSALLSGADGVRFAGRPPATGRAAADLESARAWIERFEAPAGGNAA
jgi:hypothetical protein